MGCEHVQTAGTSRDSQCSPNGKQHCIIANYVTSTTYNTRTTSYTTAIHDNVQ